MEKYKAYLFDMDGTLVNSEPLKGKAIALACASYGADVDFNIYKEVMGESWAVVTGHFFRATGIAPELSDFNVIFRAHYEKLLKDELTLIEGAREFIEMLRQSGKKCGVVSSAATWMVSNILESLRIAHLFDLVITQEHVARHKPDPAAYQLALSKLVMEPDDVLIFEDSAAGVAAGIASGCEVIAIRHGFNGGNDLSRAKYIIDNFNALIL